MKSYKWEKAQTNRQKRARDISLKWGTLKVEMMVIESLNSYIQKSNTNKITNILKYRERVYESNKSHMLKQNRTKKIVRNFRFLPKQERLHVFSRSNLNFKSHKLQTLACINSAPNFLIFTQNLPDLPPNQTH